jgi:hypothetical protein
MSFYMGLDLGQAQDFSAAVVADRQHEGSQPATYSVVLAHRWPLQTPYPAIIRALQHHLARPEMRGHALAVDYTGCGRPVVDELRNSKLPCTAVGIHGGLHESRHEGNWNVPKRNLVGILQVLLQSGRLTFARGLPLLGVLQEELVHFRQKIDPQTAHDSYSAWRERDHDDLVLALALACWLGERLGSQAPRVDLSRAFIATPPLVGGPSPASVERPRSTRFFPGVTSDEPQDLDWDEVKGEVSRGDRDIPDRSRWVD